MTNNQIINAAPMAVPLGTEDLSTRELPRVPLAIPQHLPKFFLYTRKGPAKEQLVSGAELARIYGKESFDLRGKYANHATVFANLVNAEANAIMVKRLIPDDAGPEANLILYLDVLATKVDDYDRNPDGSYKLDTNGDPIVLGQIDGYKVKWTVGFRSTVVSMAAFGSAPQAAGSMTDPLTLTQSVRYPIMEFKCSSQGEWGNDVGIRLWAPTTKNYSGLPKNIINNQLAYPFFMSVIKRPTRFSTPGIVPTLFNEQQVLSTFKPNTIDTLTNSRVYVGDSFINAYQSLNLPNYPDVYGDFGDMRVYQANIDSLLDLFTAAEIPVREPYTNITSNPLTKYLFNFVSGVNTNGAPYHSFVFDDSANSIKFSNTTNVYAGAASDGTMSFGLHATLTSRELAGYLNENNALSDDAVNVESIIYDSGYPVPTKNAICNMIAVRKDTFVVLGTHVANARQLDASEEYSSAVALRTRLQMFPESDYFGTPVMRGMIIGGSGKLIDSLYNGYLPLTAEVAIKSARYMGASNGKWKNGKHFDAAPGSILEFMRDINTDFIPASIRNRNWDVSLNWVQAYDRRSFFFPALKTVYEDDTSVLNSYFTAMAICYINKVTNMAWREFSGVSHLTNAQLIERVNAFVNAKIKDKFDNRFVVVPDAFMTDMDLVRGFSWTLPVKIYSPNMKTVMTTYVQSYRIEDLNITQ
jgi:hypothetical protein